MFNQTSWSKRQCQMFPISSACEGTREISRALMLKKPEKFNHNMKFYQDYKYCISLVSVSKNQSVECIGKIESTIAWFNYKCYFLYNLTIVCSCKKLMACKILVKKWLLHPILLKKPFTISPSQMKFRHFIFLYLDFCFISSIFQNYIAF